MAEIKKRRGFEIVSSRWWLICALAISSLIVSSCNREDTVEIHLGGKLLSIPRGHFTFSIPTDRSEPSSLVLHAFLPGFTMDETRSPYDGSDEISIHIEPRTAILNAHFSMYAAKRDEAVPFSDLYDLRTFETIPGGGDSHMKILFFHRDQVVSTFIRCEPDERAPPCYQVFNADGFAYELRYRMTYLADWQQIQDDAQAFIRGLELP